jgi:hypothetical protein
LNHGSILSRRRRALNYLPRNCGHAGGSAVCPRFPFTDNRWRSTMTATAALPAAAPRAGRKLFAFELAAALDILVGLDLVLFGGWIAAWMLPGVETVAGIDTATLFRALGIGLIAFGALGFAVTRGTQRPAMLWALLIGAELWVVASVVEIALFAGRFSNLGLAVMIGQAVIVAALAWAQFRTLRARG